MNNLLGMQIGPYRMQELIRQHEYTATYKAYHQSLDRYVVLKLIDIQNDLTALKRFQTKAQAILQCRHQNIVPIYEYGLYEGLCYVVMPVIKSGQLLSERRPQTLPALEVLKLGKLLFSGLAYAHSHGLLHHNIQPESILIAEKNWPMLLDFALSKSKDEAKSMANKRAKVYTAPELLADQPGDQRSDLYSLSAVLYELLTGRLPKKAAFIPVALGFGMALPLAQRPLAKALRETLQLALECEPSQRFQSAQAMAYALDQLEEAWRTSQDSKPRAQLGLKQLYYEGVRALAAEQWNLAIDYLQQVVMLRPNYKDAFDLLTVARERLACAHLEEAERKSASKEYLYALK